MMRVRGAALLLLVLASGLSACGKVQARTSPPPPDLEMPPPPARALIPVELPPAELPAAEPEPPPVTTPPSPPPKPASRPAQASPPVAAPPPAITADPPPAPILQTTTDVSTMEKKTRDKLNTADSDLNAVKYDSLSRDARAQYNQARGFVRQGFTALAAKNYSYAESLANKAATVASLLPKG